MIKICFAQHAGQPLFDQQDAVLINQEVRQQRDVVDSLGLAEGTDLLLAVADGVSVSPAAARASRLLLELLVHRMADHPLTPRHLLDGRMLREVHQGFCSRLAVTRRTYGAATTLAALNICRDSAAILNCGDSRVYRIRQAGEGNTEWQQLSEDHTLLQAFRDEGIASEDEDYASLYNGLAHCLVADSEESDFAIHRQVVKVEPGDTFLLTTDGVHDTLGTAGLASLYNPALTTRAQVLRWREAVLAAGSPDNLSLIFCRMPS